MSNSKNKLLKIGVKGMKINVSAYARDNNISWSTALKRLNGVKRKSREFIGTKVLDEYIEVINYKVEQYDCSATSVYYLIKERGYKGSLSTVIKYISKLKKCIKYKATLRVETSPGLQAQIDWKERLTLVSKNNEQFTVNIFLYILTFSKFKYIELTADRTQPTLFRCIVNAFKHCNGVPHEIWFDNMKTVVDYHDINSNEIKFNDTFFEFSRNAMFKPIACRPYRPCTKGLAENLAKVMDRLRVFNEEFESYDDLNKIVRKLNEDLNNEISQATGQTPNELFLTKEKEYLTKVNLNQFDYKARPVRKVSNESMINYNNVKYSVPLELIGQLVEIDIIDDKLQIYYNQKIVISHQISNKRFNYKPEHYKDLLRNTFPSASDEWFEETCKNRLDSLDVVNREKKVSVNEK